MKDDLTLIQALVKYRSKGMISFHTPGHKNNGDFLRFGSPDFDYTELQGLDSLFSANSCIAETERRLADLIGSRRAIISAGGCTSLVQAMLRLALGSKGKLISSRIIHASAVNAMALLDITPVWVLPRRDAGPFLPGRVHASDIELALKNNPDAQAVYLTSPDYYGVMSDIGAISDICGKHGVPLLVDCAHGAHLVFVDKAYAPSCLGASMTAYGAHKTLPVMTGGAWLAIDDKDYCEGAKEAMSLFASSSPSYPIMASIDLCRIWLETHKEEDFSKLWKNVDKVKQVASERGIGMPFGLSDPLRLTLQTTGIGLSAAKCADILRENRIEPEFYDDNYVVLIPSPMNDDSDFDRLADVIQTLKPGEDFGRDTHKFDIPKAALTPREALFSKTKWVDIDTAKGCVCGQTVFSCPPGIPLCIPGELIDTDTVGLLNFYGIKRIKVIY